MRLRRLVGSSLLAALGSIACSVHAESASLAPDLRIGLMRYAMLTHQPWTVLTEAPAQPQGHAMLLRGLARAELGMDDGARSDLQQVAGGKDSDAAQAQLGLATIAMSEGKDDEALKWLQTAAPVLKGEARERALYKLSDIERRKGALEAAAGDLGKMNDGYWAALGYMNLATAYAKLDSDPSRTLVALHVAAAMLNGGTAGRDLELLDRINLIAGYLTVKSGQYDSALGFLNQVRLDSYYAPQALYLHGLAQSREEDYRDAIQFWHRARKYPLAFEGVADASMGMGLAFDESGYLGQAGDAYLGAASTFEAELVNIRKLEAQVRKDGAWKAMMVASKGDNVEWFLADSKSLSTPRQAYLMRLMEQPKAQAAAQRVAELVRMDKRLAVKQHDLMVFADMLQQRLARVRSSGSGAAVTGIRGRLASLQARYKLLHARLQQATSSNDLESLVSGDLAQKFRQLDALHAQAVKQHAGARTLSRIARLHGLLVWRAQEQESLNSRQLEATLQQAGDDLTRLQASVSEFDDRLSATPAHFRHLLERVTAQQAKVADARATLAGLRQRSEQAFDQVTLAFLDAQGERIATWRDRSNQEIAHLYEYLAITQRDKRLQGGGQ